MDDVLKLIDELRKRGAIEIKTRQVSVRFASPLISESITSDDSFKIEPDVRPEDLDRLMHLETSRL